MDEHEIKALNSASPLAMSHTTAWQDNAVSDQDMLPIKTETVINFTSKKRGI